MTIYKLLKNTLAWRVLNKRQYMSVIEFSHYATGFLCGDPNDDTSLDPRVSVVYREIMGSMVSDEGEGFPVQCLCGYSPRCDENGVYMDYYFPQEAYRAFCKNKGIDYPFDGVSIDEQFTEGQVVKESGLQQDTEEPHEPTPPNSNVLATASTVTWPKIQKLMRDNPELEDALTIAILWHDNKGRYKYRDQLKRDLNPKAKRNEWGAMRDYSVSKNQMDAIVGIFMRSGTKRRGKKFLPWKNKKN